MWKGVKFAYVIVAFCLYPVAIGGFWAYGNQVASAPDDTCFLTVKISVKPGGM